MCIENLKVIALSQTTSQDWFSIEQSLGSGGSGGPGALPLYSEITLN